MNTHTNRYGMSGAHPSYGWTSAAAAYNPPMLDLPRFLAEMEHPAYPRTAAYDPVWVMEMSMGPITLWLLEGLAERMELKAGMKVLDLGCGLAASSIFLAREYGVEVWAADLWIDPEENRARIEEAGLAGQVHPLRAEAHSLPFEAGQFDTAVSIDAWHYFGTDVRYLAYLLGFLNPGAQLGIVVPANGRDPDGPDAMPLASDLAAEFGADWFTFRSLEWWHRHWSRTPGVAIKLAEDVPQGRVPWQCWIDATEAHYGPTRDSKLNAAMLAGEAGERFGFVRLIARRE